MSSLLLNKPVPLRFSAKQLARMERAERALHLSSSELVQHALDLALAEWEEVGLVASFFRSAKNSQETPPPESAGEVDNVIAWSSASAGDGCPLKESEMSSLP